MGDPAELGVSVGVRRALLAVLAVGLMLRMFYLVEQPSYPSFHQPEVDAHYYVDAARRIARGDLSLGDGPMRMSPGYFYFLGAVFSVFGDGPWAPRLIQIALGMGLLCLIFDTTRRLLGARWALLPSLAAAVYGPYVYFEGHLLPATLGAFLHALLMWAVVAKLTRPGDASAGRWSDQIDWLWIGLIWGAGCVVRPNALLLVFPLAFAVYRLSVVASRRQRVLSLAALGLGAALAIAPITLRNIVVTGEVVLLTSHGGVNIYVGNGPGATGSWRAPKDVPGSEGPMEQFAAFHAMAERELGRTLTARDADNYWLGRTRQAIFEQPLGWGGLMLRKLHLYFNGRELHNVYDYEFMRVIGTVIGAPLLQFGYLAPLGLLGIILLLLTRGAPRFIGLYCVFICVAVVLVFVTDRYRLPVVAPLLIAATFFVRSMTQLLRERRLRSLGAWGGLLVVAVLVAIPVAVNKRFEEKYFKLGSAYLAQGNLASANWALKRSLEADGQFLASREKLAVLHERTGDPQAAIAELVQVERVARARGAQAQAAQARATIERITRALP